MPSICYRRRQHKLVQIDRRSYEIHRVEQLAYSDHRLCGYNARRTLPSENRSIIGNGEISAARKPTLSSIKDANQALIMLRE
jgi:hypothetical protein|tara:strand:+ start:79 stop:324 length:246 start_codon:yes stop_codon:yes gene_type:complete